MRNVLKNSHDCCHGDQSIIRGFTKKAIKDENSIYKDCNQASQFIMRILSSEIDVDLKYRTFP